MVVAKGLHKLRFDQELISTVTNHISTKELISRLQELYEELSSIDPDSLDISSVASVKDQLVNKKLLKNANTGIQTLTACCLSDILRIYAPDAPYNAQQLSDIFKLFFNTMKHLNNTDNGYHNLQMYLISRLSEVRSIVLITDLPNSDTLTQQIFNIFYDLVSSDGLPSRVVPLISDILTEIISESNSVPHQTLKLILNKFLTNNKSLSKFGTTVPGYKLSLSICNSNIDRMARLITQFFSEIIYDCTKGEGNFDEDIISEQGLSQLKKLHTLAIELWKNVPELLSSVMGLIDNELDADDETVRDLATKTIGEIIAVPNSRLNFVETHSDTYVNWIKKPLDRSPTIRSTWLMSLNKIILNRSDIISDINKGIMKTLVDSDEKVRLVSCQELVKLPSAIFLKKIATETIMATFSRLSREKHVEIRNTTLLLLSNLYDDLFDQLYKNDPKVDKLIGWIPDDILKLIYINEKSINALVDEVLFEKLIGLQYDSEKRTTRLLTLINNLSEKGRSAFFAITKRQQQMSQAVLQLIKIMEKYNEYYTDFLKATSKLEKQDLKKLYKQCLDKVEQIINWLSESFPDSYNASNCFFLFTKLNNKRFFKLLSHCATPETDYDTIRSCTKELVAKFEDSKSMKLTGGNIPELGTVNTSFVSPQEMIKTFKLLIYRSSVIFYNTSNIGALLNVNKNTSSLLHSAAQIVLENISSTVPAVLKINISQLIAPILNDSQSSSKDSNETKGHNGLAKDLKMISHFTHKFPDLLPNENEFMIKLKDISLNGKYTEAKYAIRIISDSIMRDVHIEDIVSKIWPLNLEDANKLNTHLSTISEIFLSHPDSLSDYTKELSAILASHILLRNVNIGKSDENLNVEDEDIWITDEDLENGAEPECVSKILCLRIFTNWLISYKDDPSNVKLSELIFKLFNSLISNGGEIVSPKTGTYPTLQRYQSRLRLQAGICLLKIARYPMYNTVIDPSMINKLIFLIQDEKYEIRSKFVMKLRKSLTLSRISDRFLPLSFFLAHEPNSVMKDDTRIWIRSMFKRKLQNIEVKNEIVFEKSFIRFLHMLSHHQELADFISKYDTESDAIAKKENFIKAIKFSLTYITFALDLIATSDNISLIFYLTTRIKQYYDSTIDESLYKEHDIQCSILYIVSDLTQLTIKSFTHNKNWNLTTWPGTVNLMGDIFERIKDKDDLHTVISKSFIPDKLMKEVMDITKEKSKSISGLKNSEKRKINEILERSEKEKSSKKLKSKIDDIKDDGTSVNDVITGINSSKSSLMHHDSDSGEDKENNTSVSVNNSTMSKRSKRRSTYSKNKSSSTIETSPETPRRSSIKRKPVSYSTEISDDE
ncbi:hypothetical protein BVG19_g4478 [[Candida] boidinii]|nr:hypothetical protein BVG19_g4478 [[Candida] boidinii]OWB52097.1 hypothetical protein B5S27_g3669 [[Candida] boidinii]